jgi:hypothetical protein
MHDVTTIWTFTRGAEAVQISRVALPDRRWCLLLSGPGAAYRIEECDDLVAAATQQAEEERRLIGSGFQFAGLITGAVAAALTTS